MEEPVVREHAEAFCAALVAGDVERAIEELSPELRQNLGEVLALLPLPATEATITSIERGGGAGFTVVIRLVGDTEEVEVRTRWKDRDGRGLRFDLSRPAILGADGLPAAEHAPMIDPDALETDHPALAQALGGGAEARAAIDDLVALLRRAGVELPSYPMPLDPPDAVAASEPDQDPEDGEIAGVDEETAVSRGEFFQIITGSVPDRLTD